MRTWSPMVNDQEALALACLKADFTVPTAGSASSEEDTRDDSPRRQSNDCHRGLITTFTFTRMLKSGLRPRLYKIEHVSNQRLERHWEK
jgi:hypothetical protein